jgi:hypothetical protein
MAPTGDKRPQLDVDAHSLRGKTIDAKRLVSRVEAFFGKRHSFSANVGEYSIFLKPASQANEVLGAQERPSPKNGATRALSRDQVWRRAWRRARLAA